MNVEMPDHIDMSVIGGEGCREHEGCQVVMSGSVEITDQGIAY